MIVTNLILFLNKFYHQLVSKDYVESKSIKITNLVFLLTLIPLIFLSNPPNYYRDKAGNES